MTSISLPWAINIPNANPLPQVKRMIGRNDDRRKEDAVKKAELELKKKKEEVVREVCVVVSRPPV